MKRRATIFLQIVTILIGIGTLALLLWEPHIEGRNVNATLFEIYFQDPFLAYVYVASIAFFMVLYQAFVMLGYVRKNAFFSEKTVYALRRIRLCAFGIMAFVVGAEAYFAIVMRGKDDIAGGVMLGLVLLLVSAAIVTVATLFERVVQKAVDMKAENNLIV